MARFCLIQRGTFRNEGKYFIGPNGIVTLDYMGHDKFQFVSIQKALRRLMYNFSEYEIFNTGIYTLEKEELMVFCREKYSKEILQAISRYIEKPYRLKAYSELEKVPVARKKDTTYDCLHCNFWWCIDVKSYGDWIAFFKPYSDILTEAIKNERRDWWLTKPQEIREDEYKLSLR